jgi:predicted  nucleic acid-binding Zn-ribbon protein
MTQKIELLRCRKCGYEFTYVSDKMERKCRKCKNKSLRKINYMPNKTSSKKYHYAFDSDNDMNQMQYDCYGNPLSKDAEDVYTDQEDW